MPPRFAYWTILAGGLPTAFRATDREDLLPTFNRLKQKHPDAEMKYFARGRLWRSREEALSALTTPASSPKRGRDWRPGGDHVDPRQRFNDERKAKNQDRRRERWELRNQKGRPRTMPVSPPALPETKARPLTRPRPQGASPKAAYGKPVNKESGPHSRSDVSRGPREAHGARAPGPKLDRRASSHTGTLAKLMPDRSQKEAGGGPPRPRGSHKPHRPQGSPRGPRGRGPGRR